MEGKERLRLPGELRIVDHLNPDMPSPRYPFSYEKHGQRKLHELRRRYRLRSVVSAASSEFEEFILLRDWVRSRWAHGWNEAIATDALDGMALLEDSKRGLQFCCGSYAILFVQCLLSLGHQARRISISVEDSDFIAPDEGNVGHSVPEVWSNDLVKWVLVDPDFNCHYEHGGIPLSALEIHDFWLQGRWREVEMVRGKTPLEISETPPEIWAGDGMERVHREFEKLLRFNVMDYYHFLSLEMGNDHLTNSGGRGELGWVDEHTPPRLVRCNLPSRIKYSQDPADLYWPINLTHIDLSCSDRRPSPSMTVELENNMPNFMAYQVRIDERGWRRRPSQFRWRLRQGTNSIEARSVNQFGIRGPSSKIRVRYSR